MPAKALRFEGAKMVVSAAAAMMISSSTRIHQCTMQSKICLSTSLHGMVRVSDGSRVFDVNPKKSTPHYKGVGVKINAIAADSLNVNNINVGLNGFVEEETKIESSPNWEGRFVEDGLVFRQCFAIRSYEIGPDKTVSIETLMSHLQETALNSIKLSGSIGDGFGTTIEMSRKNLIWVVSRTQLQMESYPSWGDIVEIDTWVNTSGKNSMEWNWIARDTKTNTVLVQGTSIWAMMNKKTRKLSKIPDGVREEIQPCFTKTKIFEKEGTQKLNKLEDSTASYICSNLSPRWSDLDANQHVNNIKYISWILESMPVSTLQDNELANIALEYRRECMLSHTLQSLSSPQVCNTMDSIYEPPTTCKSTPTLQFNHLLQLQDNGLELLRARTKWRPKIIKAYTN
ncbi:hypothetical protein SUGI_0991350 [Cryptomeria japonica]|uniref:palmitoyl-acyl carrier protein thioesterase, chloroplastic n=1 Tax=Cryptomeria japonica TaxID=3369 RepID=UPI00241496B8|nr:palmitoyl-acyl carrier protein thioesterase, chloroplastic [Cryptomeria japonica]GLJ46970.1 hypothetical protein SUGI_0991350 [Cryptomeria japonica]